MMRYKLWCLLLCTSVSANAQEARDPTVAPAAARATADPASPTSEIEGMTVLVRDGKAYLMVGSRWYSVGDRVGQMRIDRITETEVWLHDGRALLKVPRFAGIEKRETAPHD